MRMTPTPPQAGQRDAAHQCAGAPVAERAGCSIKRRSVNRALSDGAPLRCSTPSFEPSATLAEGKER